MQLCRCEAVLGEFLRGIKRESKTVNFANMVNILVLHSQSEGTLPQLILVRNFKPYDICVVI